MQIESNWQLRLYVLHLCVACVLSTGAIAGSEIEDVVGPARPKLVVAKFTYGQQGKKAGAEVDAKVVYTELGIVNKLLQSLGEAESKDVVFYMYDSVYLIFLDDAAEVLAAYVYYPVTKPEGGFLKAEASRISASSFLVKQEGFDHGLYSPQALEIINKLIPEELIWMGKK